MPQRKYMYVLIGILFYFCYVSNSFIDENFRYLHSDLRRLHHLSRM